MKVGTSLQFFLTETLPDSKDLQILLLDITRAAKYVQHAIMNTEHGFAEAANQFGEEQVKLDVLSNDVFKQILHENSSVYSMISEEEAEEIQCCPEGTYTVVFDPLDGSSLVEANFSIGSIFGIYNNTSALGCKPSQQVAALYVLYGPRTILVLSTGDGVHEFLLDDIGEFILIRENITVKPNTTLYSAGNLRAISDNAGYKKAVQYWLTEQYTLRYSGCMVADIHHIFTKGHGIFTNVGGSKYPNGKLRHVFECGPFAFLMEQAGGSATNGVAPITSIPIETIDQRTPLIIGSTSEVEETVKRLQS